MENQSTNQPQSQPQQIVIVQPKSVGLSLILTFFFGPFGMLYSTITGGAIMLIISLLVGVFTLGIGLFFTWPVCMIWGAIAASKSKVQVTQLK